MTVVDEVLRETRKARYRNYEIVRVRVTPFIDPGAVAPRGREVWLHPADWHGVQRDLTGYSFDVAGDSLLGVPVVHGFPVSSAGTDVGGHQ